MQDLSAGCCKPFSNSPSRSDSQCSSPTDSPVIPVGQDQSGGLPWSDPQCWGRLSLPIGGAIGLGETAGLLLHWPGRGTMSSVQSCSSYPSGAICLGVRCRGTPTYPSCSRILSGMLARWTRIVSCSCDGKQCQEGLCHHLGDVPLLCCLFL